MKRTALLALSILAGCPAEKPAAPDAGPTAATAATAGAAAPADAGPPPPPPALTAQEIERAEVLVRDNCLMCHAELLLQQQRLTPKQWEAGMKKMRGWGAPIEEPDAPIVVRYLSEKYSTQTAPWVIPKITTKEANAALEPQPDGKFAKGDKAAGKKLWDAMCAMCHGPNAEGAAIGTALADRPLLYRAREFAQITREGRRRMPQFTTATDKDIAAILAHLRSLE